MTVQETKQLNLEDFEQVLRFSRVLAVHVDIYLTNHTLMMFSSKVEFSTMHICNITNTGLDDINNLNITKFSETTRKLNQQVIMWKMQVKAQHIDIVRLL